METGPLCRPVPTLVSRYNIVDLLFLIIPELFGFNGRSFFHIIYEAAVILFSIGVVIIIFRITHQWAFYLCIDDA